MAVAASVKELYLENPDLKKHFLKGILNTGRTLGRGAFGTVIELQMVGTRYAGKQIHDILLGVDLLGVSNIIGKFVDECRLMAEVKHPNIVQFMGICILSDSDHPMLVMEYLDMSLDYFLHARQGHIPLSLKYRILLDISRGLLYLHSHDPAIIHRDVTARNILLNKASLQAKIADLGNALMTNPTQLMNTLSKMPGTALYMPPEASGANPAYNTSLDVFSFGHLALFVAVEDFPCDLLPSTYTDPNTERVKGYSEVERRQKYISMLYEMEKVGRNHSFCKMITLCLHNLPAKRPNAQEILNTLEDLISAQEDPYSTMEGACKLDLIQLAQLQTHKTKEFSEFSRSQTQYGHPARSRVDDLLKGIPGVMDLYRKRGGIIKLGVPTMEWKQYVFKIENQTLKYFKSNKPTKAIGEMNLRKVTSVSIFESEDTNRFCFVVCCEPEATLKTTTFGRSSVVTSSCIWRLSTLTAEERFSWMEAIRPGSTDFSILSHDDKDSFVQSEGAIECNKHFTTDPISIELTKNCDDDEDPYESLDHGKSPKISNMPGIKSSSVGTTEVESNLYDLPYTHEELLLHAPNTTTNDEPVELYEDLILSDITYELYEEMQYDGQDDSTVGLSTTDTKISTLSVSKKSQSSSLVSDERQKMEEMYETLGKMLGKNSSTKPTGVSPNLSEPSVLYAVLPDLSLSASEKQSNPVPSSPKSVGSANLSPTLPQEAFRSDSKESTNLIASMPEKSCPHVPSPIISDLSLSDSQTTSEHFKFTDQKLPENLSMSTFQQSSAEQSTIVRYENDIYQGIEEYNKAKSTKPTLTLCVEQKMKPPVPKPRKFMAGKAKSVQCTTPKEDSLMSKEEIQASPQNKLTSLRIFVNPDEDDSTYIPRPEWAKASTLNASLNEDDSLQLLQRQALFIPISKIQNLKLIGQGNSQ